jgi:drug/metabolite transporter (DMT)-like permease
LNKNERIQKGKHGNKALDSYRFYGKITLFALSGAIMIGHGTRMLYQGIFSPGSFYAPNTFDLFFDWLTLAILGCFILWFAMSLYYQGIRKETSTGKHKSQQEEKIYLHPT